MGDKYDEQIAQIARIMEKDGVSPDEQDKSKLVRYHAAAKELGSSDPSGLVYEALLYLKLKNSQSADPLQDGDKFGVGFS